MLPDLSLYIHIPWCIKKCPYCDFNSYATPTPSGVDAHTARTYRQQLERDLQQEHRTLTQARPLQSIFIGGGTPSLFPVQEYDALLHTVRQLFDCAPNMEVTLELNPGTIEYAPLDTYLNLGINRLSIGVQSFNNQHLQQLGRVHQQQEALHALHTAQRAGFTRINVDLMHGLPQQTVEDALDDLHTAITHGATHISWYQLTIEPNTIFYKEQPILPDEDTLHAIQQHGEALLLQHGFVQYEVSAWRKEQPALHNINYWQFGDYIGIGAGAHGKLTRLNHHTLEIMRYSKTRHPKDYMHKAPERVQPLYLAPTELPFEFMMNALRLKEGFHEGLWAERTGLSLAQLYEHIAPLIQKKLIHHSPPYICCTEVGFRFLNHVLNHFLHTEESS